MDSQHDERLAHVQALYESGLTLREIAEQLHSSDEVVRRLMRDAGIPRRPRGHIPGKHLPANGRLVDPDGYILLRRPDHPFANSAGYVREHRLVMEKELGRLLTRDEVVHHRDGNKANNHPDNLGVYPSNAEHKAADMIGNQWAEGDVGNPRRRVRGYRHGDRAHLLDALRTLAETLDRPVQRTDLVPPWPSYRTLARAFGSWREAVALSLAGWDGVGPQPRPNEG